MGVGGMEERTDYVDRLVAIIKLPVARILSRLSLSLIKELPYKKTWEAFAT